MNTNYEVRGTRYEFLCISSLDEWLKFITRQGACQRVIIMQQDAFIMIFLSTLSLHEQFHVLNKTIEHQTPKMKSKNACFTTSMSS